MQPEEAKSPGALIDAAVRGELHQGEALRLCKECPELVTLALLAAAKRIAEQDTRIVEQEASIADAHKTYLTTGKLPQLPE